MSMNRPIGGGGNHHALDNFREETRQEEADWHLRLRVLTRGDTVRGA